MTKLILLAGAVALASAGPALAKPNHAKGKGGIPAHVTHGPQGYGAGGCPPGLAKKAVPCVPPGQAKKFGIGQRIPLGYNGLIGYDGLPYSVRNYYGSGLDPRSRYIYDNNYIYRVDPTTMVVSEILRAIL